MHLYVFALALADKPDVGVVDIANRQLAGNLQCQIIRRVYVEAMDLDRPKLLTVDRNRAVFEDSPAFNNFDPAK